MESSQLDMFDSQPLHFKSSDTRGTSARRDEFGNRMHKSHRSVDSIDPSYYSRSSDRFADAYRGVDSMERGYRGHSRHRRDHSRDRMSDRMSYSDRDRYRDRDTSRDRMSSASQNYSRRQFSRDSSLDRGSSRLERDFSYDRMSSLDRSHETMVFPSEYINYDAIRYIEAESQPVRQTDRDVRGTHHGKVKDGVQEINEHKESKKTVKEKDTAGPQTDKGQSQSVSQGENCVSNGCHKGASLKDVSSLIDTLEKKTTDPEPPPSKEKVDQTQTQTQAQAQPQVQAQVQPQVQPVAQTTAPGAPRPQTLPQTLQVWHLLRPFHLDWK